MEPKEETMPSTEHGENISASPRLRLAGTSEENFLACVKQKVWGALNSRFKDWQAGDLLALKVNEGIAGLAEITGPPFVSEVPIWKDRPYPHRISIRFISAMHPANRLSLSQIKNVLASEWEPKYGPGKWGLGIQKQDLLSPTTSKAVIDAILSRPNDLAAIESTPSPDAPIDQVSVARSWIFQASPKMYDVDSALAHLKQLSWLVNQHAKDIHAGDRVFLWRSGEQAAIVAVATILGDPVVAEEPPDERRFNIYQDKFSGAHLRVRLVVDQRLAAPLYRENILKEPKLSNLSILKAPQGTNFSVNDEEAKAILGLIAAHSIAENNASLVPYSIDEALSGLFISEGLVREMLSLWRIKKNLVLQGPPGVGKTFIANRLAYALIGFKDPRRRRVVQFHQSLSYEDFMQGYRPYEKGFERRNGAFFEFCDLAAKSPNDTYVLIIDEINRGNLSKIFGEALMLIEADKRSPEYAARLTYSLPHEPSFFVPANVYLIGTMNTADRSLALVDYALRRRFSFATLKPELESKAFNDFLLARSNSQDFVDLVVGRMSALNKEISADKTDLGPGFAIGHSFFCPSDPSMQLDFDWYRRVIQTEILPLLAEYWFDDPERADRWGEQLLAPP